MMLTNKVTKDIKIAYKISLSDAEPFNKKTIANCNITSSIQFKYLQPIITQYFIDNKSEIWLLFLIAHSKR